MHTNDAPSSITRLINIGIEPYLISASVNAVLAQRLVRKICEHCKEPLGKLCDEEMLAEYDVKPEAVMHGAGCEECRNTGYQGRVGIYEFLSIDDAARDMITANPSLLELRRHCKATGMRTLRNEGFRKVASGVTTVEEVLRVTETEK